MAEAIFEHEARVRAALHAIVSDPAYGAAALSRAPMMANLLKDYLPDAPRESGLLIAAAQADIAGELRRHAADGLDADTALALASTSLAHGTAFGAEACSWAARELAIALGMVDTARPSGDGAPATEPETAKAAAPAALPSPHEGAASGSTTVHDAEAGLRIVAPGVPASPEVSPSGEETRQAAATAPRATEPAQPLRQDGPVQSETDRQPRARRRAAIILGSLAALILIVVVVAIEGSRGPSGKPLSFNQLRVGDCLSGYGLNFTQSFPLTFYAVPCRQQHVAEVFFKDSGFWPSSGAWPGSGAITSQASAECDRAFTAYDGVSFAQSGSITDAFTNPSSSSWRSGDRSLTCMAWKDTSADPGGAPIYGSIKNSDR